MLRPHARRTGLTYAAVTYHVQQCAYAAVVHMQQCAYAAVVRRYICSVHAAGCVYKLHICTSCTYVQAAQLGLHAACTYAVYMQQAPLSHVHTAYVHRSAQG